MSKVDTYIAGYLAIDEVTHEESELLASNLCVVGMPLTLMYNPETELFTVHTTTGETLGTVRPKNRIALRNALENNWTCRAYLSLVYFEYDSKSYKGELVYQFYNVRESDTKKQEALDSFSENTARRLAAGQRPRIALTGTTYDQIIETGDWTSDETEPIHVDTGHKTGNIIVKRKQTMSDKMIESLINHDPKCRIWFAIAGIVIALLILFFVWKCSSGA